MKECTADRYDEMLEVLPPALLLTAQKLQQVDISLLLRCRQSGYQVEIVMGANALHQQIASKEARDQGQPLRRENCVIRLQPSLHNSRLASRKLLGIGLY